MLRTASALIVVLASLPAWADESVLSLEANVGSYGDRGGVFLSVKLVAAGEVKVATDALRAVAKKGEKDWTIRLAFSERKDSAGRPVIPSANRLEMVSLRKGEVAEVHVANSPDLREALSEVRKGTAALRVEYEVSADWGKRFEIWSGKVAADAKVKTE